MKIVVRKYRPNEAYYVLQYDSGVLTTLEAVFYATAGMLKDSPQYASRLNMDEARIYANQRAEFYRSRIK